MRSLSNDQYSEAEETKTKMLLSAKPYDNIDDKYISDSLKSINNIEINKLYNYYIQFLNSMKTTLARDLTAQELKSIKSYFYSMVYDNLT